MTLLLSSVLAQTNSVQHDMLIQWHPDYKDRCLLQDHENLSSDYVLTLQSLLAFLQHEPELSASLLDSAHSQKVTFCLSDKNEGTFGYFDYRFNLLTINENLGFYEKSIVLVHELRHIQQFSKGYCQSLEYSMKDIARLTLAAEADVQAITTLFAWRLKERGISDMWQSLDFFDNYSDITLAFEKEVSASKDEVLATRAAFTAWYDSSWRTTSYYLDACSRYLETLDDTHAIEAFEKLPPEFFDNLCELPNGSNYGCQIPE